MSEKKFLHLFGYAFLYEKSGEYIWPRRILYE